MAFKIVIVGCGSIAWRGHGPACRAYAQRHPDVELAACVDPDRERAESFREAFGFGRAYTDLDAALETEKPDAVCLLVPYRFTADLAEQILNKGYPLLTEKPPGMTREETLRLIAAARRSGVPHQVAWNRRHMPVVTEAKRWLDEQAPAGRLHHIRYDLHRVDRVGSDASITMVHGIDTVKYWVGSDYKQVRFRYQPIEHHGARETNIYMECEFESGVWAHIHYFPLAGAVLERAVIDAAGHTMVIQLPFWTSKDSPGSIQHLSGNEHAPVLGGDELGGSGEEYVANGFLQENASFFDHLRAGIHPPESLASSLQQVEIAEAIRLWLPVYQAPS
ncbi:Gfo/Idh/MocA family oxidoreductase [Paenibacillus filicis]|uniref:Gfo/Idh/MocA family oxidoreductase n=1 Tax=Paenibacillus filicis TaxID=669464 RepID=A0ABU9DJR5_9BACL